MAVQVTRVVPIGKVDIGGAHAVVTGGTPPVAVAGGTCICTGAPVVDWPSTSAGQVSTSGGMSGAVGVVGVSSPHDTVTSATAKIHSHPLRERRPIREAGLARNNRSIIPSAASVP